METRVSRATAGAGELDGAALIERLSALAESARPPGASGVTRLAWSEADLTGRALLADALDGIAALDGTQVEIWTDAVGNLIAEWPGSVPSLAPLAMGSHLDTVVEAGHLDGAYGTVAAFEIVAALARAGEHLRHPVRAVAWVNEEGVVAPPFTGSRVAAGEAVDLEATGPDGRTLAERIRTAGGSPERIGKAAWGPTAGYLELHIEQGPVLDELGVPIGVVTGITGSRRGTITVIGNANHAGTTPMHLRADALVAAAHLVNAVEELATAGPLDVATVGSMVVQPGVTNVVPGKVVMSYDLRSLDDSACDEGVERLRSLVADLPRSRSVAATLSETPPSAAVAMHPLLQEVVAEAAAGLGLASMRLASGAGHDAQQLASLAPTGMLFVPSTGGVSHQAAEATPPEALVAGARTLFEALRLADARLDP